MIQKRNKKHIRNLIFKAKKRIKNASNSSNWKAVELNRDKLKLIKTGFKKNIIKKRKSNRRVLFTAPRNINYYKRSDYELTNKFLNEIRDCVLSGRKIFIDFSETKFISAAAMLSFLAEIDVLVTKSKFGANAVNFSHPKDEKTESILNQVGFYDIVRKTKRATKDFDDVSFWKYTSGICSEPMLAKEMMIDIKKEIEKSASRKLYRGFTEAMSNSVEHAYIDDTDHDEEEGTAKWWTFAGINNKEIVIVICDKGVGIPKTLPKTQGFKILKDLISSLGFSVTNVKDSALIKASTMLQETRTLQKNRGKGLNDIKSVIDSIGSGYMGIFSNNGRYIYNGKTGKIKEVLSDHKTSVNGTIIEWTFPCEMETTSDEHNPSC
ncbi:ATP-binding protein [Citrobacter cronae]|uniref:ATP-binding protein n=2 Tax=Citrobacter freundii complex TaxID=1344959 RepID=UPI0033358E2A